MRGLFSFSIVCLLIFSCLVPATQGVAAPTLGAVEKPTTATLNESSTVTLELSWQGDPAEYLALAPSLDLGEWAKVTGIESTAFAEEGTSTVRHTITFVPRELGEFTSPDISLHYLARADIPVPPEVESSEELIATNTAVEPDITGLYEVLEAGTFTVRVLEPSDYTLNLLGIAAILLAMFGSAFVFYRRNALQIAASTDVIDSTVPAFIHEARKQRLDEDYYAFYQSLMRGADLLHEADTRHELHRRFKDLAMAVGYKGAKVTEDDLDGAIRELERAHATDSRPTE
jgi:hypothetical protein